MSWLDGFGIYFSASPLTSPSNSLTLISGEAEGCLSVADDSAAANAELEASSFSMLSRIGASPAPAA